MTVTTSSPAIAASLGIARSECKRSLFVVDTSSILGSCEYVDLINDVVRMVTIYSVAFYMTNVTNEPSGFADAVLLIALGVAVYWLIVHKVVRFV